MCILVVEDDFLIRSILVEELTDAGYEVRAAETGDEAIALLDGLDPPLRLLVTDIHMPGQRDGLALAEHVRRTRPAVPIIYTTGRPDALGDGRTLGIRLRLVRKPYMPSEILARIEELLAA